MLAKNKSPETQARTQSQSWAFVGIQRDFMNCWNMNCISASCFLIAVNVRWLVLSVYPGPVWISTLGEASQLGLWLYLQTQKKFVGLSGFLEKVGQKPHSPPIAVWMKYMGFLCFEKFQWWPQASISFYLYGVNQNSFVQTTKSMKRNMHFVTALPSRNTLRTHA